MMPSPIQDHELDAIFAPLAAEARCGLAVSGGADSMALMHLAARWRGAGAAKPRLTVLTVDHGLRLESAKEAEFVAQAAQGLGLTHKILCWRGGKPASNVQAAARAARYDLMAAYAHAHGLTCLVTAHHLDDQAETVLMRLGRGSGIHGLAGIPGPGHWAGVPILRPLLDVASYYRGTTGNPVSSYYKGRQKHLKIGYSYDVTQYQTDMVLAWRPSASIGRNILGCMWPVFNSYTNPYSCSYASGGANPFP